MPRRPKKDGTPGYAAYKYQARRRIFVLSPEQEVEAKRIADDLVASLSQLVNDRLEESKEFRLYLKEDSEEIPIVRDVILKYIRKGIRNIGVL